MSVSENKLALVRLRNEVKDIDANGVSYYQIIQDDVDKFLFYFLIKGTDDSDYKGGYYLGKIILPPNYPRNHGHYSMLTPNGRFSINKIITLIPLGCVSGEWSASYTIRASIESFYWTFMCDDTMGMGRLFETSDQRKTQADNSVAHNQENHPQLFKKFDQYFKPNGTMRTKNDEIEEYIASHTE